MASLKELVELYVEMENTSSHKKIVGLLTSFFRSLDPDDVRTAAYLVLGTVGPEYEDTELGIREKLAIRSIADAFGISRQKVEKHILILVISVMPLLSSAAIKIAILPSEM